MFICRVSLNNKKLISSVNRTLILLIQFYLKRLSGDLLATKQRMKIVLFHFGRSVVVGKYRFNLHIMIMCGFFSFSFYTYVRVIFFASRFLLQRAKFEASQIWHEPFFGFISTSLFAAVGQIQGDSIKIGICQTGLE